MKSKAIEQDFYLEDVNPIDFYGANNANLNLIKDAYPDVRFIARGNSIKMLGEPEKLEFVLRVLHNILNDIRVRGPITSNRILNLLTNGSDNAPVAISSHDHDVLVHGVNGNVIRAKTTGQQ